MMQNNIKDLDKIKEFKDINPEEDAIFDENEDITKSYINYIKKAEKYVKMTKEKYNINIDRIIKYINETLDCDIFIASTEEIIKRIEKLKGTIDYISINEEISILGENLNAVVLEEKDNTIAKLTNMLKM